MDDDDSVGVVGPKGVDVARTEALVHRAVTLPQQECGRLQGEVVEAAAVQAGIPHRHVLGRVAELVAGVAPEMLVGEEQDLVAAGATVVIGPECPGQHGTGV